MIRTRFAPSPTGFLHLGNARTALFAYLYARKTKGRFMLRIEDTDLERTVEGSEPAIVEDLKWLGLHWDEGPDVGGPVGPYRCSERMDVYKTQLKQLQKVARVYRCFCTPDQLEQDRKLLSSQKKIMKYVGRCLHVSEVDSDKRAQAGEIFVWRLHVSEGADVIINDVIRGEVTMTREVLGDFILCRSSGVPVFLFANAIDDAVQEISHVIRGEDHLSNTFRQVLIYQMLGYALPVFAHLPMIGAEDGGKLSKREGSLSIRSLRETGFLPAGLVNYLALLGWSPGDTGQTGEKFTLKQLEDLFDLSRVSKGRALFDFNKLKFLNQQHLNDLSVDEIVQLAPAHDDQWRPIWKDAVTLIKHDLATVQDVYKIEAFLKRPKFVESAAAKDVFAKDVAKSAIKRGLELVKTKTDGAVEENLKEAIKVVGKELSLKGKDLYFPFRVAITGAEAGPELLPLTKILGRNEVVARLESAVRFSDSL